MEFIKRLYIIPVFLLVFIILFVLTYKEVERKAVNEFDNQEQMLAQQAARGIEGFFNYYHRELRFLSTIPYVADLDNQGEDLLEEFYLNHNDQIEAVTRMDENGILLYTYPDYSMNSTGQDLSTQDHVNLLLKTQKPVISDVFRAVQGIVTIAYHVPVIEDGVFKGSLAILIPIDKIGRRYLENIKLGESGYAFMISEKLVELYCPKPGHSGHAWDTKADIDSGLVHELEKMKYLEESNLINYEGTIRADEQNKEEQRAILYKIPLWNTYWTIIISAPVHEIYATLKGFRNKLFLSSLFVLIIMLTYFYSYAKAGAILKAEKGRKAAENALIESEERWSFALEGSGDGVWDRNMLTGEVFYSPRWKEMLGYQNHEIENSYEEWVNRIHPDDLEQTLELVKKHLNGEVDTYQAEYRMRCKDGSFIWILDRGKVISHSSGGKPIRIVGTHSDISERKNSEEQLHILSRAVDQSPASIVITDTLGRFEYVNQKFVNQLGFTFKEVLQRTNGNIKYGLFPDKVYNELWETIKTGKIWTGEFQSQRKGGEVYWEKAIISPVQNSKGETVHFIAIMEDITEKKILMKELIHARDRAEESDKLKSSFLQNMSHEIRTPMNAIIGFSDLLEQQGFDAEECKAYISIIKESGLQLLNIVNNILTISFIDTQQEKVSYSRVDIRAMVRQLHSIFLKEAEHRELSLVSDPDPDFPELICRSDATKLNQILTNMLANALKFTHQGRVKFGFRVKDQWIEFFVEDTGIGIDPKVQDKIFHRFNQADENISVIYGGTGLGLSISRAFVELLGGEIYLNSKPGQGSRFSFTVPLVREKNEEKLNKMSEKQVKTGRLEGVVILVAEDEEFNFLLIREFLKSEKAELIHASNGTEAVAYCKSDRKIDLVLMDIKMPEINGQQATRIIRELRPGLPIIAQSAYAIQSEIKKYLANGFDDYITKPIIQGELIDKCARMLNR